MLQRLLTVLLMAIATFSHSQEKVFDRLNPKSTSSLKSGKWYLIKKDQLSVKSIVARELSNGWIIAKPTSLSNDQKAYVINNEWKWSPRLKLDQSKRSKTFLLTFTALPKSIPSNATVIAHQNSFLLRSNRATLKRNWLDHPDLIWVDAHKTPTVESILRRHDLSVNDVYYAHHVFGERYGVMSSIKEQQFRTNDLDLIGISDTTERSFPAISSHATDMATLVSGKGISFLYGKGVSTGNLISTSYDLLFPEPSEYFLQYDCRIQNHSYGVGVENYYGAEAVAYDNISIENSDLLHVFSSGNSGDFTALEGKYTGLLKTSNLTGTFKQAKNVLVVGATDSLERVKPFSSVGPSFDGRIKPELVAYGGEGSSDAAAIVSGMSSYLVGYAEQNYGRQLSSQEVKALLIAGTRDIGASGPDYKTGFGSASLSNSMQVLSRNHLITDELTDAPKTHHITLEEEVNELKVVLYWHDPAASIDTSSPLIHDLDLSVITPDGNTFHPWVLSTYPNKDSLERAARRGFDRVNNVEMLTIDQAPAGEYQIQVDFFNPTGTNQQYSIAYLLKPKNQFEWTFPTSSDHLISGEPTILRWNSTLNETSGDLYWKQASGDSILIKSNLDLAQGQIGIIAPDILVKGHWTIITGNQSYESETVWLEAIPELEVYVNCENEVVFQWSDPILADQSKLFNPEDNILPSEFQDTIVSIEPDNLASEFVALSHQYENKEGIRSYVINYSQQGVGCYLSSFITRITNQNEIEIDIRLSGIDLIETLSIERRTTLSAETIYTTTDLTDTVKWLDSGLASGIIEYRVTMILSNGNLQSSDWQTVFFADGENEIVFPNPVDTNSELSVLSDAPGGTFQLIDTEGRKVLEQLISNTIEYIPLNSLRQGVYLFRIVKENRILKQGKVLVK